MKKTEIENYIKENRLKKSMLDMSIVLGISYNKVRNYMVENNLMISKELVLKIRSSRNKEIANQEKPWNWNACL